MKATENIQEQLNEFLLEGKRYVGLQKELIRLVLAEKLSTLLTLIFTGIIFVILISMMLFFPLMALASWIGQLTTPAIGYLVVALIIALCALMVYFNRQHLIEEPITRAMTAIFAPEDEPQKTTSRGEAPSQSASPQN